MEDSFKGIIFGFILMATFGMLVLTAVVSVGTDNGMDTSEIAGGALNLDRFNNSIKDIEATTETLKDRFDKQSIWSALAGVVVEDFFKISRDIVKLVLLEPLALVMDIMHNVFGIPLVITSIIIALFIFTVMFAIWRLLKVGD